MISYSQEQINEINQIELPPLDIIKTSKRDANGNYMYDKDGQKIVEFEISKDLYNKEVFYITLEDFLKRLGICDEVKINNTIEIMRECDAFYNLNKYRDQSFNINIKKKYNNKFLDIDTLRKILEKYSIYKIRKNDGTETTFNDYYNNNEVKLNHEQLRKLNDLTKEEVIRRNDHDYVFRLKAHIYELKKFEQEQRLEAVRQQLEQERQQREQQRQNQNQNQNQRPSPTHYAESVQRQPDPNLGGRDWNYGGKRKKSKRGSKRHRSKKRGSQRRRRRSKSRH